MKLALLLTVFLVALVHQAICGDDACDSDRNCDHDECCRWNTFKTSKECKDKGDDVGDRCGGDHLCDCDILKGMTCVQDSSFIGNFRRGTGSCQRLNPYLG